MAKRRIRRSTRCRFCREDVDVVDYKDIQSLKKLFSSQGRLFSRKRSGNCSRHQRMVKKAVKHARYLALLPYS